MAAGHLVQHGDFLDQPQRIVKRQQIDQRTEPDAARPLRRCAEKQRRRRRHAERRGMVFGEVIAEKPGIVGHL